ncbi:MAG: hypothetical protein FJY39_09645 [Betaproteobacteria bacterium]|nr:hypothetical protein [Betaproteobacteria bacterium]
MVISVCRTEPVGWKEGTIRGKGGSGGQEGSGGRGGSGGVRRIGRGKEDRGGVRTAQLRESGKPFPIPCRPWAAPARPTRAPRRLRLCRPQSAS